MAWYDEAPLTGDTEPVESNTDLGGSSNWYDTADVPEVSPPSAVEGAQSWLDSMSEVPVFGPVASGLAHPAEFLHGVAVPDPGLKTNLGDEAFRQAHPDEARIANAAQPFVNLIPGARSVFNQVYGNSDFEREHPLLNTLGSVAGSVGEFAATAGLGAARGLSPLASTIGAGALTGAAGGGGAKGAGYGAVGGAIAHGVGAASEPFIAKAAERGIVPGVAALGGSQVAGALAASAPELVTDPELRRILEARATGGELTPEESAAADQWIASQVAMGAVGTALGAKGVTERKAAAETRTLAEGAKAEAEQYRVASDADLNARLERLSAEEARQQEEAQAALDREAEARRAEEFARWNPGMSRGEFIEKPTGLAGDVDKKPPVFGPEEDLGVPIKGLPPSPALARSMQRMKQGAPDGPPPVRLDDRPITLEDVPRATKDQLSSDVERGRYMLDSDAEAVALAKATGLALPSMDDPEGVQAWANRLAEIRFRTDFQQAVANRVLAKVREELSRPGTLDIQPDTVRIEGLSPGIRMAAKPPVAEAERTAPVTSRDAIDATVMNAGGVPIDLATARAKQAVGAAREQYAATPEPPSFAPVNATPRGAIDELVRRTGGIPGEAPPPEGYSVVRTRPESPVRNLGQEGYTLLERRPESPVSVEAMRGKITLPDGQELKSDTVVPPPTPEDVAPTASQEAPSVAPVAPETPVVTPTIAKPKTEAQRAKWLANWESRLAKNPSNAEAKANVEFLRGTAEPSLLTPETPAAPVPPPSEGGKTLPAEGTPSKTAQIDADALASIRKTVTDLLHPSVAKRVRLNVVEDLRTPEGRPALASTTFRPDGTFDLSLNTGDKRWQTTVPHELWHVLREGKNAPEVLRSIIGPEDAAKLDRVQWGDRLHEAVKRDTSLSAEDIRRRLEILDTQPQEREAIAVEYLMRGGIPNTGGWLRTIGRHIRDWFERVINVVRDSSLTKKGLRVGSPTTGEDVLKSFVAGKYSKVKPGSNLKAADAIDALVSQHVQKYVRAASGDSGVPAYQQAYGKLLKWAMPAPSVHGEDFLSAMDRFQGRNERITRDIEDLSAAALDKYAGDPKTRALISGVLEGDTHLDPQRVKEILGKDWTEAESKAIADAPDDSSRAQVEADLRTQRLAPLYNEARAKQQALIEDIRKTNPTLAGDIEKARNEVNLGSRILLGLDTTSNIIEQTLGRKTFDVSTGAASRDQFNAARDYLASLADSSKVGKVDPPKDLSLAQEAALNSAAKRIVDLRKNGPDMESVPTKLGPNMRATIAAKKDLYLSRLYESHVDARYRDRMNRAFAKFGPEYRLLPDSEKPRFLEAMKEKARRPGTPEGQEARDYVAFQEFVDHLMRPDPEASKGANKQEPLDYDEALQVASMLLRDHDLSMDGPKNPRSPSALKQDRSIVRARTGIDPVTRRFLGEITANPKAQVGKTVLQQQILASTAKFHSELLRAKDTLGRPLVSSSNAPQPEFGLDVPLPQTPEYGKLAGHYVNKATAEALSDMHGGGTPGKLFAFLKKITVPFKIANVPMTAAAHGRQWASNGTGVAIVNGVSPLNPSNWKYLRQAWDAARTQQGPYHDLAQEHGVVHKSGNPSFDVAKAVREIDDSEKLPPGNPVEAMSRVFAKGLRNAPGAAKALVTGDTAFARKAGELFAFGDYVFKMASFIKQFETNGHDPKRAAEFANRMNYDYNRIPMAVKVAQDTPFVGPFIKFSAENARVFGNAAIHNPVALAGIVLAVKALASGAMQQGIGKVGGALGMSTGKWTEQDQKDWETMYPILNPFDARGNYLIPYKYGGGVRYINAASALGFQGIIRALDATGPGKDDKGSFWRDFLGGAPPMEFYSVLTSGKDQSGYDRSRAEAGDVERLTDALKAGVSGYSGGTLGRDLPRLARAINDAYGSDILPWASTPDRKGQVPTVPASIAGVFPGIRPRQVYPDALFADAMHRAVSDFADKAQESIRVLSNPNLRNEAERDKAREQLYQLVESMMEKRGQLEDALDAGGRVSGGNWTDLARDNVTKARASYDSMISRLKSALRK